MSTYHQRCLEALPKVAPGESLTTPQPLSGRSWVDDDGVVWKSRGGLLSPRAARKFLAQADVRVIHVCVTTHELPPEDLPSLVADLEVFWRGQADPHADFAVGEFRSAERARMAMVVESC